MNSRRWVEEDLVPQFGVLDHASYTEVRVRSVADTLRRLSGQRGVTLFDPYSCADSLGIKVREVQLPTGASGCLDFSSGRPIVELASADSSRRKRFTLAHELAHLAFMRAQPALPDERWRKGAVAAVLMREERLCNSIAAELLMPARRFTRIASSLSPSFGSLVALSDKFLVSLEGTLARVRELRLWSIGLYEWTWCNERCVDRRCEVVIRRGIRRKGDRLRLAAKIRRSLRSVAWELRSEDPDCLPMRFESWPPLQRVALPGGVDVAIRRPGRQGTLCALAITTT